jgi:hypothetical protein
VPFTVLGGGFRVTFSLHAATSVTAKNLGPTGLSPTTPPNGTDCATIPAIYWGENGTKVAEVYRQYGVSEQTV